MAVPTSKYDTVYTICTCNLKTWDAHPESGKLESQKFHDYEVNNTVGIKLAPGWALSQQLLGGTEI
jgi:hypothetical protein